MESIKKKIMSFPVIYEVAEEGGYFANVPVLPGCHTQGDTLEEAETNIKEAISLYLESLLDRNEQLPREAKIFQGRVEVEV